MIKPVNNHILIEPVKHESFMSSQKETYEEVGVVIDFDKAIGIKVNEENHRVEIKELVKIGDKVFFDSYLAARYPKNDKEDFWLVKWEDVRAIENAEEVPK